MRSLPILVAVDLILALPAFAGDGVLEINQTCAVNTGCFSGDAPGFPVTIDGTAGRSYRLASDLVVPNENTDGIVYSADDIAIDLGGFSIRGPVVCSGAPLACVPASGSGSGVERASVNNRGLSLENGSISGMGARGVLAGPDSVITNLRVRTNRLEGIFAGSGSILSGDVVQQNGSHGMVSATGAISGNTVHLNGGYGISASSSTILGNTVFDNESDGIAGASGGVVSGNTVFENGAAGISGSVNASISNNMAYMNAGAGISVGVGSTVSGNTTYANQGAGIQTSSGCLVIGNTVRQNHGFGLVLGSQTGYRENVITSNTGGTISGTSLVNLGSNACEGSAVCP